MLLKDFVKQRMEIELRELYKEAIPLQDESCVQASSVKNASQSIDNTYESVLKHVHKFPARFEEKIAEDLRLSSSSVSRYLKRAEEEGLIVLVRIPRGVGNTPKVARLTEKGEQRFGKQELGKGDIAHFRYQYIDIPQFYKDNLK